VPSGRTFSFFIKTVSGLDCSIARKFSRFVK